MSVLLIVGPKCIRRCVPWPRRMLPVVPLMIHGEYACEIDRRTDGRTRPLHHAFR